MKKLLTVSLVAMMAVTTARAEIASKAYVDQQDDAVEAIVGALSDLSSSHFTSADKANVAKAANAAMEAAHSAASGAETALGELDLAANEATGDGNVVTQVTQADGQIAVAKNITAEETSNKVTSLSASSTDAQYPSAKAVYDADKAITDSIGTVPANSTVMAEIAAAQQAATYDDTALAGRVTTAEGDIDALESGKEDKTNKTTTLSASSTDAQYPSAKAVYDADKAITDSIGTVPANSTVMAEIAAAQTGAVSGLNLTDAQATGTGVVTQVTQTNGQVAVTKADPLTTMDYDTFASGQDFGDGSYSLTMKVVSGTPTYKWELIERASGE